MKWSPRALEALELFVRDVPAESRDSARHRTVQETEAYCDQARIRTVGYDQVVVGHIRATPAHLRMGLKSSLRAKGVIVEKYDQHFFTP